MPADPLFSVAIPAHNEEKLLPRLLDSIELARARYRGDPAAIEVVVGNNGSTDATAAIARSRGYIVADVERRAIAAARNGAARASHGSILCFIDADSILHPETFNEIAAVMQTGRCAIGASGVKMERMSLGIGVICAMLVPLAVVFALDTGVVFCRREDFLAIGGYNEELMVAEDVDFMRRMKRHGRKNGARFRRLPTARAITSSRKFDRHGDWHYFTWSLRLFYNYLRSGRAVKAQFWSYWYNDR